MLGDARMQQNGEESVGSVNMPTPLVLTEQVTPQFGSPTRSGLLRQISYSPSSQRFSLYGVPSPIGAASPSVPTEQSGVVWGLWRPYVPTLAKYQQRLSEQVSVVIVSLFAQVAQTSQSMQQTGTIASHVLETAQQTKAGTNNWSMELWTFWGHMCSKQKYLCNNNFHLLLRRSSPRLLKHHPQ